jgi:O-antigen/teichoic acid export membrane protein
MPSEVAPKSQRAPSLKSRALRAGSWTLTGHIANQILRLLGSLVLTRLLAPDLFGIMAVATAISVIAVLLADIGLPQAIVQSPRGDDPSFLNTAWTLQVLRGWLIWGVCLGVAVMLFKLGISGWLPLGSVYASPTLPAVIAVASFSSVILGFQSVKAVTANRRLDLRRVIIIDVLAQVFGLSIAAVFGWLTHSIWSFVAGSLCSTAFSTLSSHLWLPGPADRFEWDRTAVSELVHFGKWIFLSSGAGVLAANGDRLLLGAWITPTVLGYYSIAFNVASAAEAAANRLFINVSLPALSEVARQRLDQFPAVYFRMRYVADPAFVGTAGFLFATGEWLIRLLYDSRYAPAGAMLQWLSFGLLFTRYNLAGAAYLALGQPNYVTAISITKVISLFVLVPLLFYLFGFTGAIFAIALHLIPTLPWVYWFNRKHGLNNLVLELAVLCTWPIGWLIGLVLVNLAPI